MSWNAIKNNARWRLKYELFRRVLPRLEYEPYTIKHLSFKAWPHISALTSSRDYSDGYGSLYYDWDDLEGDGSDFLRQRAAISDPVVIRGYAKSSPLASWSMDTLRSESGHENVVVRVGNYLTDFGQPRTLDMRLDQFLDFLHEKTDFPREDLLCEGIGPYVGNQQLPALAAQLPRPDLFAPSEDMSRGQDDLTTFWLGSADAETPLHCHHFCDTFVIQLIGRRSFTLVPPHQAMLVGYMPHNINMGMAAYDPYAPNREQFPGADRIDSIDIDLGPGDALLLPGFWFHSAKLSAPSMSASRFVKSKMPLALGGGSPQKWQYAGPFHRGW